MCLYTWPCLLLVFVKRVCIFVFYVCVNPVGVLSISHLACRVTVFVMCAWLCILHAHVHVEGYMFVHARVEHRARQSMCMSKWGHHSHIATNPLTTRGRTLLANMEWNCMAGLTGFWAERLRKTPDYFPSPQDHHLSSDMITTWPTCQQNKSGHSFHGNRVVTSH